MKSKIIFGSALIGLLAMGCAVPDAVIPIRPEPAKPMITPNGLQGYAITCGVESNCYEWAGYKCQSGYTVLQVSGRTSSELQAEGYGYGWGVSRVEIHSVSMVVECKPTVSESKVLVRLQSGG